MLNLFQHLSMSPRTLKQVQGRGDGELLPDILIYTKIVCYESYKNNYLYTA